MICKKDQEGKYEGEYEIEIFFGEKTVPMVPFVKEVAENVVHGLVKSLDGFDPAEDIKIVLKRK